MDGRSALNIFSHVCRVIHPTPFIAQFRNLSWLSRSFGTSCLSKQQLLQLLGKHRRYHHEILLRARRILRAPDPSHRPGAEQLQLFRSLPSPPGSSAHSVVGTLPASIGLLVLTGYICLLDACLVYRWHRCPLCGLGALELHPPCVLGSAPDA